MGKFIVKMARGGIKFDLLAGNGQVIARSEMYASEKSCLNGIASVRKNALLAEVEDQSVDGFYTTKNPKFEVYQDRDGLFRFRLKARNGEVIVSSETYKAKASCLNGVSSVRRNAPEAEIEKR